MQYAATSDVEDHARCVAKAAVSALTRRRPERHLSTVVRHHLSKVGCIMPKTFSQEKIGLMDLRTNLIQC